MCRALLLPAVFLLPRLVIIGIILSFQLSPSLRFGADMKLAAAQQLAEADPAGYRKGIGDWPAHECDNQSQLARFRRAA